MKHAIISSKLATIIFSLSLLSLIFVSCASTPKEIPTDLSAQELIQLGQSSYEKGKNQEAIRYFNTVVQRYGTDTAIYIEARYEIGHLLIKTKKYDKAEPILQEIKDIYLNAQPGTLPGAYKKLTDIELAKIPKK